jgi:hypothetical protein
MLSPAVGDDVLLRCKAIITTNNIRFTTPAMTTAQNARVGVKQLSMFAVF